MKLYASNQHNNKTGFSNNKDVNNDLGVGFSLTKLIDRIFSNLTNHLTSD